MLIRNCWIRKELASIIVGLYYNHHQLRVNREPVVALKTPLLLSREDGSWDLRATEHCLPASCSCRARMSWRRNPFINDRNFPPQEDKLPSRFLWDSRVWSEFEHRKHSHLQGGGKSDKPEQMDKSKTPSYGSTKFWDLLWKQKPPPQLQDPSSFSAVQRLMHVTIMSEARLILNILFSKSLRKTLGSCYSIKFASSTIGLKYFLK